MSAVANWASNIEFPNDNKITRKQKILVVNDPQSPLPEPQRVESAEPGLSDFYSTSKSALEAIQTATQAFAQEYGQPNIRLRQAHENVARLEAELREAKMKLESIIAEGDSVSRFSTAVLKAGVRVRRLAKFRPRHCRQCDSRKVARSCTG